MCWDAVSLAARTVPAGPPGGLVQNTSLAITAGTVTIAAGRVTTRPGPSPALCAQTLDLSSHNSGRSTANCNLAYPTAHP